MTFFGGEPQYIEDDARYNVRGIVLDKNGNIAMMKIENSEYYKDKLQKKPDALLKRLAI